MKKEKILIVDDEQDAVEMLRYVLEQEGYLCEEASNSEEAFVILDKEVIDLIVLDVMLFGMSGFDMCREIKKDKRISSIPIILLTGKSDDIDKIVGLELGAEDYIVKPYNNREVIIRIQKILQRSKPKESTKKILCARELEVDVLRHKVSVNKKEIILTPLEFKLLVTLMEQRGNVLSRDQILERIWNISAEVTTRTIDVRIKRLREKLGEMEDLIETIRGFGYRFQDNEF